MHAFVRFRKLTVELPGAGQTEHYCAWYEPEHHIVRLVAPFFQRRYGSLLWSILTPDESVHWNGDALQYGPGAERSQAPGSDELEALYSAYYAATYNPARKNPALFRKHVPAAFVRHMPELDQLPALFALGAPASCAGSDGQTAAPLVPEGADLAQLRAAAQHCRACAACELGSQVVFGVGPSASRICLIGEQPGDEEDQRGVPFVGPAGRVLDRALAEAGLDRETLYLTNSVKHFNYIQRGKRRLHQKPHLRIVHACKPWLEAELAALRPHTIVCLGATAARSLLGPRFSIKANFGRTFETPWAEAFMATYHPAAILRMNEPEASAAYSTLVRDLVRARLHTESPQLGVAP
jgi:DNA polymerase